MSEETRVEIYPIESEMFQVSPKEWQEGFRQLLVSAVSQGLETEQASKMHGRWLVPEKCVDERYIHVAEDLSKLMERLIPETSGLAVVLSGSAVHGGSLARRMLRIEDSEPDLDWFFAFDFGQGEVMDEVVKLARSGKFDYRKIISDLGIKHGLGRGLHSCVQVNPWNTEQVNLKTVEDTANMLNNYDFSSTQPNRTPFLTFLNPSFPKLVNEESRRLLHDALCTLFLENQEQWQIAVGSLAQGYVSVHRLDGKHLAPLRRFAKGSEYDKVVSQSGAAMSQPIIRWLNSTSKS